MTVTLPSVPFAFAWEGDEPPSWKATDTGLEATAAAATDWYVNALEPEGEAPTNGARLLGLPPEGDWRFIARVRVGFGATFDAGTLMLHVDEGHWSKLAFEYAPDGAGMVVSVVTRGASDDANHWVVDGDAVWLRVSRVATGFAFHASKDGERWEFVRCFAFGAEGPVKVGFGVQSPTGGGCDVAFDRIGFDQETLTDLRDGS